MTSRDPRAWPRWQIALTALAVAGCHVTLETEIRRSARTERVVRSEAAAPGSATLGWSENGRLRFVERLVCPTDEIVHRRASVETAIRPSLATFTVGALAIAAGGVLLTTGLFASRPATSPFTYAGLAGLSVGAPLAVGPWIGNRSELRDGADPAPLRRAGPPQPCGERPIAARFATLSTSGLEIRGAVGPAGELAISPYQWVDAYHVDATASLSITATIDGDPRRVATVIDAAALAAHARAFLDHADFDPTIEPLRSVPGIVAGPLRVGLVTDDAGPAVRIALALHNTGPGDAWAVRGQISAPGAPAIDGRWIYAGKMARGAAVARELTIPVTDAAAAALRAAPIELSVELRDAHGTAPSAPIRFRGRLPNAMLP